VKLHLSRGRTLEVSGDQIFLTNENDRSKAEHILEGARLRSSANQVVRVSSVEFLQRPRDLHWIEVERGQTAFALDIEVMLTKE
jgi:hypothetical protein